MKKILLFLAASIFVVNLQAQCNGRYETEIFNTVSKTTVNYSDVYTGIDHEMDIYTPDGDTEVNRPVVFFIHGGSFYKGDKGSADCVDFCETFAKRGYVAVSANYRLADLFKFLGSQEVQFKTVLQAIADVKSAIRYMRKDFENGDTYGIDTSTIFVGGYSAGAVLGIHLAYIDEISELPTSPVDVQAIVDSIGGTLEGDAGNDGFSSKVSGVVSFAGGINDVNLIDANDEPLVAIHGTDDGTVSFDCSPALGNPAILTLCGANAMYPAAKAAGVMVDTLVFQGEGHGWPAAGKAGPEFNKAVEFTSEFLYRLLPCYDGAALAIETESPLKFEIFPNPSDDAVSLVSNQNTQVSIFSMQGSLVSLTLLQPNQALEIGNLKSGLYLVEAENGNNLITQKLIVQ